jgi:hypothetical protein
MLATTVPAAAAAAAALLLHQLVALTAVMNAPVPGLIAIEGGPALLPGADS